MKMLLLIPSVGLLLTRPLDVAEAKRAKSEPEESKAHRRIRRYVEDFWRLQRRMAKLLAYRSLAYLVAGAKPISAAIEMRRLRLRQNLEKSSTWLWGHSCGLFSIFPSLARRIAISRRKRFPHYLMAGLITYGLILIVCFEATPARGAESLSRDLSEMVEIPAEHPSTSAGPSQAGEHSQDGGPSTSVDLSTHEDRTDSVQSSQTEELSTSLESSHTEVSFTDNKSSVVGVIDFQYATNGPVSQGFSLSNFVMGVRGDFAPEIRYTAALGQARDVAGVQLPFLLARQATIDFENLNDSNTAIRVGLFRPMLNPQWSQWLSGVPDYFGSHSALLLGEQIGVEGAYLCDNRAFELRVGLTNGNGIFGLNTNNARALHGFLRATSRWSLVHLDWGASVYTFRQSAPGGANYRENWTSNLFAYMQFPRLWVRLGVELLWGNFWDADSDVVALGWAAQAFLPFLGHELLIRAEHLEGSPAHDGRHFKQFQIGPAFYPSPKMTVFLLQQYVEPGVSAGEVTTFARLRMELP